MTLGDLNRDHIRALRTNAFKNGALQEPIYGQNQFIGHESLSRPVGENGEEFSIANISKEFYEKGMAIPFDVLTSSAGIKHAKQLPITLNIAVETAMSPDFFNFVKSRMEKHEVKPNDVIFEILEHDIKQNAQISHLQNLKNEGFRFALDDISISKGDKQTSRENKNRLAVFGSVVDFVKIDGPLVRAYFEGEVTEQHDADSQKTYTKQDFLDILDTIKTKAPQAQLIAERVYTTSEAKELFDMGISGVQGRELKNTDFCYTNETYMNVVQNTLELECS